MRVQADFEDLHNQLLKVKENIEKKMTGMVQSFASNIAADAIDLTPFNENFQGTIGFYYNRTRLNWGLKPAPGHAKGGWMLSLDDYSDYRWNMLATTPEADKVKAANKDIADEYKLGQDIFLVNNVPYVANDWPLPHTSSLESGYSPSAPNGISRPFLAGIYKHDLKTMYDNAEGVNL